MGESRNTLYYLGWDKKSEVFEFLGKKFSILKKKNNQTVELQPTYGVRQLIHKVLKFLPLNKVMSTRVKDILIETKMYQDASGERLHETVY